MAIGGGRGAPAGVAADSPAPWGVSLGPTVGEAWRRHRFDGPLLRDDLMDAGYLVETLETATTWSRLLDLRQSVREALSGPSAWTAASPG